MSTGAIVMMIIGCGLLWGGLAFNCSIAFKHMKDDPDEMKARKEEKARAKAQ